MQLSATPTRRLEPRTAPLAVHRWQAPATCGELLQGALDGEDFMVNCPIDLFATAHAVATQDAGVAVQDAHAYGKVVATLQNLTSRAATTPGRAPGGVALQLDSPIPRGKGMASSTADASCALAAAAACLKLSIDEAEAARLLTAVEPSDCTHFRGIAQLNFLSGALIDRLPAPSGLHVLVVDCGGEVETLNFDRDRARSVYARHSERLRSALLELKRGLCTGCNRSVGRAATKSTELSQLILPKKAFPELRALAPAWGVLGINCAHSGTVLGLLYEPEPGREQLLRERLARRFGPELQVLGSFRIIGGATVLSDARSTELAALLDPATPNPSMNAVRAATRQGDCRGDIVDFCVPVNPYFPTPQLLERLQAHLPDLLKHYPDGAQTHERHLAALIGVPAEHIVVANGSTEIITTLCHTARGPLLTTVPTFGRWTDLPLQHGTPLHTVPHRRSQGWRIDVNELIDETRRTQARSLVLCNPNNPTGAWFSEADVERLVGELTYLDSIVIDESFIDFSGLRSAAELAAASRNAIVVKSLGKSLGWHGVRLGYAVAARDTAAALRARLPWWNVNGVAAFVLKELAQCPATRAALAASFERIARDRIHLQQRLQQVPGLTVCPSRANFLYVELPPGVCGKLLRVELLARHGLFVRECSNKLGSSAAFLRIAVLPAADVDRLADALQSLLPMLQHAALNQA